MRWQGPDISRALESRRGGAALEKVTEGIKRKENVEKRNPAKSSGGKGGCSWETRSERKESVNGRMYARAQK